jgi:predicted GH43/DUF377 family glycosyl hydrolase
LGEDVPLTDMPVLMHRVAAQLDPDPGRVIAQLYLPGEELRAGRSRAGAVVERVLALSDAEVERLAADLMRDFAHRHRDYVGMLTANASTVSARVRRSDAVMTGSRALLLGASFTAEFAIEGAALCNPSAVAHPDQSGLAPGQLRVALSVRSIGEGHLSSIGFAEATIGPGDQWVFTPRTTPVVAGVSAVAGWQRGHLRAVLADEGLVSELAYVVLAGLPEEFTGPELQRALLRAPADLVSRQGGAETLTLLQRLVASSYQVTFPDDIDLSQQVLMPSAAEERNGIEDARFVRVVEPDGTSEYRATYTAYDGYKIAPRVLTSPDLRRFRAHRLAGPAARNKGMALFPRRIAGRHWALARSDGENTFVASSADGFIWGDPHLIQPPSASWEILQVGNCGSPIETDRGWLVLTHGVGPMRTYVIGAVLLDLDDPTRLVARLEQPLLSGGPDEREGYVPNVVYSCGGLVHDGRLWLPYAIADQRIQVAYAELDAVLDAMTPVP